MVRSFSVQAVTSVQHSKSNFSSALSNYFATVQQNLDDFMTVTYQAEYYNDCVDNSLVLE